MKDTFIFHTTAVGFIVLTILMYSWVMLELRKALVCTPWEPGRKKSLYNRILLVLVGWAVFISVLGLSGFLQDFSSFPPRIMIVLFVPLAMLLIVTLSKTTKILLEFIPARSLVVLHVFRVFVEVLLWMLVLQNILPRQMSFEGRNLDILSGLSAPIVAYFMINNRVALIIWNILSLGLLINIVGIAILSLPTPFRVFMNEPANTIIAYFPFVWLPGLLVPLAYGLHFLSLRQLMMKGK